MNTFESIERQTKRIVERMTQLTTKVRFAMVRRLLGFLRWLDRAELTAKTERIERMTEALLARVGMPIPSGSEGFAGSCSQCSRSVRLLFAEASNLNDRRCVACSPGSWLELFLRNAERALGKTATSAN